MKIGFAVSAAASLLLSSALAVSAHAAGTPSEIGYTQGSLAVGAMMTGRLSDAERTLAAQSAEDARDPARMINLGIVYSRTGRIVDAQRMFAAVADAPAETLILSDGSEVSSRVVARQRLAQLDGPSMAMR